MMYDYHGQCDLIYTTCPSFDGGKGLHIHLRTKIIEPIKWSTITSIAVKLGEDVFELQDNGSYYLNGEADADLTEEGANLVSGRKVNYETKVGPHHPRNIYKIALNSDVTLVLTRIGILITFQIKGVNKHASRGGNSFDDCVGLSSTWDHPNEGEFLVGRSGTKYSKHEAVDFGPEWQVDFTKNDPMLFVENLGQQLPDQKCVDSPLQAKDQRHLKALLAAEGGALARQAEKVCSHVNGEDLYDACFFDVLVTGDVSFAQQPWYTGDL